MNMYTGGVPATGTGSRAERIGQVRMDMGTVNRRRAVNRVGVVTGNFIRALMTIGERKRATTTTSGDVKNTTVTSMKVGARKLAVS